MLARSLPVAAFHFLRHLAMRSPKPFWGVVGGFFLLYTLIGISRRGRDQWLRAALYSAFLTVLLGFVGTCLYLLATHPGYQFVHWRHGDVVIHL